MRPLVSSLPLDERQITSLSSELTTALWEAINQKTKPLGALGALEALAVQIGRIQNTLEPAIRKATLLIFAGDHGIAADHVSPYPSAVTAQMVTNFLAGGAAANVLARQNNLDLLVVNAGVSCQLPRHANLIDANIAMGTRNFRHETAMTRVECATALAQGAAIIRDLAATSVNTIAFGEMGIGNTSAAACIMSLLCQEPLQRCVGRGAGLTDAGLEHKLQVLTEAIARTASRGAMQPLEVLAEYGGFEIAMLCGAILAAAKERMVILVDGFIVTTALLVAAHLEPAVLDYCVFSHQSDEQGHRLLLEHLNAKPLLNLGLRLGEGSGAALALPLVRAAVALLRDMATFQQAGVSGKSAEAGLASVEAGVEAPL